MRPWPRGVCPILATPFTDTGEVDFRSLTPLTRGLHAWGAAAITMFGIASEYYKLTDDEKTRMVEVVLATAPAQMPVIVSVTAHATEIAVAEARRWQRMGAPFLMLLPPFFLKPGVQSLVSHIESVASAVTVPIIVQYAPEQTG
jgi:dihydrodipicolinate synthase/N-acetylneuraminate lyase